MPRAPKGDRPPSLPPWTKPYYVGLDENGMGPRLGPMIVTSILAEVDAGVRGGGADVVTKRPRGAIAKRIGDSKKLVAFEDSALGEAWARAIAARAGLRPASPDELLATIAIDDREELRRPCPSHHADLCWSTEGEAFAAEDALVAACAKDLDRLEQKGVRIHRARVAIVCTRRLNEGVQRGLSRFDLDLHAMERLTLAARADAGDEVYALCGKVGGFDFYADRFGPLAGRLHVALVEGRARSEYLVPGVGRLAFLRDADGSHLIVGLASLVGKWARDHLMRRVVRWHKSRSPSAGSAPDDPDLPDASGYHDPVTARFIEATALVRKKHRLEEACFERVALGRLESPAPTSSEARSPKAPRSPKQQVPTTTTREEA